MYSCDSSSSSSSLISDVDDLLENDINTPTTGPTTEISGLGIDPDFQPTVDRFVIEANKRNVSVDLNGLDIQYGELDNAIGLCSFLGTDTRDILIASELRNASADLLSEIILHELGHCILGRPHSPDPTSIMHATEIIGQPWRKEVLDELFFF